MVALITDSSLPLPTSSSARPELRLIRGGLDAPARDHSVVIAVAALVAVFAAVLGIRSLQGDPPVASSAAVAESSSVDAAAGDTVIVVDEGDTLWAIARDLAPGRDPRPVVDALAARNGGTVLRAGDLLVIPADIVAADTPMLLAADADGAATP